MSAVYFAPFYFSGSVLTGTTSSDNILSAYNSYCPPEYPFQLSPGDLVRFDETGSSTTISKFRDVNEYTILEVYTGSNAGDTISFKLDRAVDDAVTSSATPYAINRYVFSKKLADETNIIVEHRKRAGTTSGGLVKNPNLLISIDDNIANVISELKSKIFSTVLVP